MTWLERIFGFRRSVSVETDGLEDRRTGRPGVGLRLGVHLEQTVVAFDDLHPGPDVGGLERDIGEAVDLDAGRDLHIERGVVAPAAGIPARSCRETPRTAAAASREIHTSEGQYDPPDSPSSPETI